MTHSRPESGRAGNYDRDVDTQTIFLAIAVTSGVIGGLLILLERWSWTDPDFRLAFMAFGFLLIGAGVLLQYGRDSLPLWLAVGVGNVLTLVGLTYQLWAILAASGRPVGRRIRVVGMAVAFVLVMTATLLPGPWPRVLGSAIYAGFFLATAWALATWRAGPRLLQVVLSVLMVVDAALYAVNAVDALSAADPILIFSHAGSGLPITSLLYLMLLVTVVFLGISFVIFVKQMSDAALRAAVADLDASLETLATGVLIVDDGRIIRANHAAATLLGRDGGSLEGASVGSLQMVNPPLAFLEAARGHGEFHGELQLLAGRDRMIWTLCQTRSVAHAVGADRAIVALTDITDQKHLQRELIRRADFDDLTGLMSRGSFMQRGQTEITRAQRHHRPIAVFVFDLDRLKEVNDSAGHAVGDQALEHVAAACRDTFREADLVGRVGGDEFAGVLPDTSPAQAVAALERLIAATAAAPLVMPDYWIDPSISIGVAEVLPGQTLDDVLARADEAMYRAKSAGGGCVVLAQGTDELREV